MTKTEQMRRVIWGLRIAIVVIVSIFVIVTIARCADGHGEDHVYTPSVIDGLFAIICVLLSLYLNSLRTRILKIETVAVLEKDCDLKREKDELTIATLTESTRKMEAHIEEIFKTCNSIKVLLAAQSGKDNGNANG